jgi:hypothetical protein
MLSAAANHSGEEVLNLFAKIQFEISAPECPTHSPAANGDVLDSVVHRNIRM